VWAWALALLLPLAQLAASWHALSHVAFEGDAAATVKRTLHIGHCDLCLTAAAVGDGPSAVQPLVFVPMALRHVRPNGVSIAVRVASRLAAYLSRAPPVASR